MTRSLREEEEWLSEKDKTMLNSCKSAKSDVFVFLFSLKTL